MHIYVPALLLYLTIRYYTLEEISSTAYKNRSQKRYVLRFILKLCTVGLFLSQAALLPIREFHRFADALSKLLDLYLPGFPGGTVNKFDSADHRTLRGAYGTSNYIPWCQAMQCYIRI